MDFFEFDRFQYAFSERVGEVMLSHPLLARRVMEMTTISLVVGQVSDGDIDSG